MCSPTSTSGSWVTYCTKPIRPCASTTPEQAAGAARAAGGVDRASGEPPRDDEADHEEHRSAWSWDMSGGLGRCGSPCRPRRAGRAGDDGAHHDHGGVATSSTREPPERWPPGRTYGVVGLAGRCQPERVRGGDRAHRDQEMQPTTYGFRSVSTVMPPTTPCAGMPGRPQWRVGPRDDGAARRDRRGHHERDKRWRRARR